jgi:hypothetical protein
MKSIISEVLMGRTVPGVWSCPMNNPGTNKLPAGSRGGIELGSWLKG